MFAAVTVWRRTKACPALLAHTAVTCCFIGAQPLPVTSHGAGLHGASTLQICTPSSQCLMLGSVSGAGRVASKVLQTTRLVLPLAMQTWRTRAPQHARTPSIAQQLHGRCREQDSFASLVRWLQLGMPGGQLAALSPPICSWQAGEAADWASKASLPHRAAACNTAQHGCLPLQLSLAQASRNMCFCR